MNKEELTVALSETLRVDLQNASRLSNRFILLGKRYRRYLVRQVNGSRMAAQLSHTEEEIKDLCTRLALRYKIVEDVKTPILRLYLNNPGNPFVSGIVVEDGL